MDLVDLGFCPRCKVEIEETTTGVIDRVRFCVLCRTEMREKKEDPAPWVAWAIRYKKLYKF